ncbi:MAG: hypothetical protein U0X73_06285 [Thermoanaerobaculia bacterium]
MHETARTGKPAAALSRRQLAEEKAVPPRRRVSSRSHEIPEYEKAALPFL